ncbi:MAG TPA: PepSY-associated TM helix domain-containing protein [Bryobacteraceae bacterium]|nr:PepSY-associated TM helix domain-containing protein [Bryobacteraceae bacterium]
MNARNLILKIHLYLGLLAGLFLVVLGLTGSIIAFEGDIDHWLHRGRWYVAVGADALPEGEIIARVERQVGMARVVSVQFLPQANLAQSMQLNDRSVVTVNPYDGSVLSRMMVPTRTQRLLGSIHQLHLRLATDGRAAIAPAGKILVSYAGLVLCLLVPTGLLLWWRTKRASVKWAGSWFRRCFDLHRAIGIYAGLFLWISAFTGVLIGFESGEKAIYALTHSSRPNFARPPQATPVADAIPIGVDRAMEIAHQTMPTAFLDGLSLPANPKGAFTLVMRVPEETSGSAHSSVTVEPYTGKVLQVHDFLTDSQGYRWIRYNRSIHTGDIWGLPGHMLMSLSSLLLVAMVATGLVIWWKKLAV